MSSSASVTSLTNRESRKTLESDDTCPNDINKQMRSSNSVNDDRDNSVPTGVIVENVNHVKKQYQEFAKLMLKIKFEKYHNSHKGQQIPEKVLFRQCMKQNIPPSEWAEFIINELKQPQKYVQYMKRDKKLKIHKSYLK